MYGIKNVDNLLRLRNLRYRQTPSNLKRVNVHAEQREQSTSVLDYFSDNWRFSDYKNQKWTFYVLCPFIIISAHRQ